MNKNLKFYRNLETLAAAVCVLAVMSFLLGLLFSKAAVVALSIAVYVMMYRLSTAASDKHNELIGVEHEQ